MRIKGIKKRLKALKPVEIPKEPPQWCYGYVDSITVDRQIKINDALKEYQQGLMVDTETLGDDRAFYEKVIEASKGGVIEL